MKYVIVATMVAGLAACHRLPQTGVVPSTRSIGTYAYHANITGQFEETGTFTIGRDTVVVDANDEFCRRIAEHNLSESKHNFDCLGAFGLRSLTLTIDSKKPLLSRWYATRTEDRTRTVCAIYAVAANGTRYCAQYRTDTYEVVIPFGGPLRVAVAPADSGIR
jgi:hypothetical protein